MAIAITLFMTSFEALFEGTSGPILLDGGLGTTLTTEFAKPIDGTALWSAQPLSEDPDAIVQAHLAFLRAGARVITTSTYQCAYTTFQRAGYTAPEAARLMRRAVSLAFEAKMRFCAERPESRNDDINIALSLGPFGATLSPTQEFTGFYPPPYGPRAYSGSSENSNTFDGNEAAAEQEARRALTEFHFERLALFASNEETWDKIDCVAFETIPLTSEIRAIKMAISKMRVLLLEENKEMKPWWISLVFPDGKYPQMTTCARGGSISVQAVAQTVLEEKEGSAIPDGLGVNCTLMEHIPGIIQAMREVIKPREDGRKPWLILYPNGGDEYDTVTMTWKTSSRKCDWGQRFGDIIRHIPKDAWSGILVGGCCRAGPQEIKALAWRLQY